VRTEGSLAIGVLGEVSASRDGVPIDLGGLNQRAVLGRMAAMASEVQDSRAIAQALFVTPRSVERTLTELRLRLGLASDVELSGALET
jgi:hypothetical protein